MNRSRSRNRLMETAFVSSTRSSTEDLDEVDRLANHPVLRSRSSGRGGGRGEINKRGLRKSKSEMGCESGKFRGLSGVSNTSWQFCGSKKTIDSCSTESIATVDEYEDVTNNNNNDTPPPPRRGMTRTITFHANLSAVLTGTTTTVSKSAPSTPPTWTTVSRTPPSTAPLPLKFGRPSPLRPPPPAPPSISSSSDGTSDSPTIRRLFGFHKSRFVRSNPLDSSSAESTPQKIRTSTVFGTFKRGKRFTKCSEDSSSSAMSSTESVTESSEMESVMIHHQPFSHQQQLQQQQQQQQQQLLQRKCRKNLQILSPISDKSQEHNEDQLDNSIHLNHDNNNNNSEEKDTNDNDCVQNVPWDMPKLRRRLMLKKQLETTTLISSSIQGSDSGISMTSQDLKDLLNVPWDMPKLMRKRQQMRTTNEIGTLSSSSSNKDRPMSVPNVDSLLRFESITTAPVEMSSTPVMTGHDDPPPIPSIDWNNEQPNLNLQQRSETTLEPPPGFEDEFYLTETQPVDNNNSPKVRGPSSRPRPKMTLSFGVNPSQKTLMFATNSPFDLNDCDDINPNIPLNRQEWYHGTITKEDAERTLRFCSEGSYLVRNLDYTSKQEFALSIKSSRGYMHMRIKRNPATREFALSDFQKKFMTIPQMIHHYTLNRLPIKGAEHMCLKHPVSIQLL